MYKAVSGCGCCRLTAMAHMENSVMLSSRVSVPSCGVTTEEGAVFVKETAVNTQKRKAVQTQARGGESSSERR